MIFRNEESNNITVDTKKVIRWISNIILCLLIILVILSLYSKFKAKDNPHYIPSIFGYKPMSVLTGSMRPVLEPGDMIVVKELSPKEIKVGDVITYRVNEKSLVTHRVVEIVNKDNQLLFKTKGDANNVEDSKLVTTEQLIGLLVLNIPNGGYITHWIRSPIGIIVLIILPIILLLGGELKNILSTLDEEEKNNKPNPKDNVDI